MKTRVFGWWLIGLLSVAMLLVSCGGGDDDDSSGDDTADDDTADDDTDDDSADDDAGDDDTWPPLPDDDTEDATLPALEPLRWGRYLCGDDSGGVDVKILNYNMYGGNFAGADEIGAALADYGPYDVVTLQECPTQEFADAVAAQLGMDDVIWDAGDALITADPVTDSALWYFNGSDRHVVHGVLDVDGTPVSVNCTHISWDEAGNIEARRLVDDFIANDPTERILYAGDWNDELGSTQQRTLSEVMAESWASLGVPPSTRVTWPADRFYGTEGRQLIDNAYFNKASGACAVDGEIINFTPPLSDHKPEWARVHFPAVAAPTAPRLLDAMQGFGPAAIALLFDRPLTGATVSVSVDGTDWPVESAEPIGDGDLVRVRFAEPFPVPSTAEITVSAATDIDGNETPTAQSLGFGLRPELLTDGGAEAGGVGWALADSITNNGWFEIKPLDGARIFTGGTGHVKNHAWQTVPLDRFADTIDAGRARIAVSGATTTGIILLGTDPRWSWLLPWDEGEATLDLYNADGRLLSHVSAGRYDPLYWQPWRAVADVPPGTRYATVTLRSLGVEWLGLVNTASFDAVSLTLDLRPEAHGTLGGNLITDPLFLNGKDDWTTTERIIVAPDHWAAFFFDPDGDVVSATGDWWMGALHPGAAAQSAEQSFALPELGEPYRLRWGAWLTSRDGREFSTLTLRLFDAADALLSEETLGPTAIGEWFVYEATADVPTGAVRGTFNWTATGEPQSTGAIMNAPFVVPVRNEPVAVDSSRP